MEGKIISCCGDCVYYDHKKHKCKNGYNDESNPKSHFYNDCQMLKDLEEYENQVRAEERAKVLGDICNVLSEEIWNRPITKDDQMHNHCIKRCIALVKQMERSSRE